MIKTTSTIMRLILLTCIMIFIEVAYANNGNKPDPHKPGFSIDEASGKISKGYSILNGTNLSWFGSKPTTNSYFNELNGSVLYLQNTTENSVIINSRSYGSSSVQEIKLWNDNITGVNKIMFEDPGFNEGLQWTGTEAKIFLSPITGNLNQDGYLRLANDGGISFAAGVDTRQDMIITSNGNVGIGTTNTANSRFTINRAGAGSSLRLENETAGEESSIRFRAKSSSNDYMHADIALFATGSEEGYLGFKVPYNNNANAGYDLVIAHDGQVGIGKTNPTESLDVTGSIAASTGFRYWNNELTAYTEAMKHSSYTYLLWDRNHAGDGNFVSAARPTFFYWDSDDSAYGYLIDTRNMTNLKANVSSLRINTLGEGLVTVDAGGNLGSSNSFAGTGLTWDGSKLHVEEINSDDQTATEVNYNAASSVLTSNNVQGALNELSNRAITQKQGSRWSVSNASNINYTDGSVGIGTTEVPSGYQLAVEGQAIMEGINIELAATWHWPDYVFENGYKLRGLPETKAFIEENGHLPKIPTSKEVEENGINVAEMNVLLLEKIEEMTLHQIKLYERLEELEQKVAELGN